MGVDFKSNIDPEEWKRQLRERTKTALKQKLSDETDEIKRRTQESHVDFQGAPFAQYAKSTAAYKRRKYGADEVTLFETGKMQAAMHVMVEDAGDNIDGVIKVQDATQAAKVRRHMEGDPAHNLPPRQFFKLSLEQVRSIAEKFRNTKLIG